MSESRIYVDIDDVLAKTIARLIDLLEEVHGRRVDLSGVTHFDLAKSFDLDSRELDSFMERTHDDEFIESIMPMDGATAALDGWTAAGHRVTLVTGRPPKTNAASRRWLEVHDFRHEALHHLNKWGRSDWDSEGLPAIRFDEIGNFEFDFAVEDNLDTAVRLAEEFEIPVALMDRPWNRDLASVRAETRKSLVRCLNWDDVVTLCLTTLNREVF